jgi:predicted phosphodiesterase
MNLQLLKKEKNIPTVQESKSNKTNNILILTDLHAFMSDEKERTKSLLEMNPLAVFLLGDISDIDVEFIRNLYSGNIYFLYGNHDEYDCYDYIDRLTNIHGKKIKIENCSFVGIEGCVRYKSSGVAHTQEEIIELAKSLPECDILLCHEGPETKWHKTTAHQGFKGVNNYLKEKQPQMCIHGHRHTNQIYFCEGVLCISLYKCAILDIQNKVVTYKF